MIRRIRGFVSVLYRRRTVHPSLRRRELEPPADGAAGVQNSDFASGLCLGGGFHDLLFGRF